MGDLSTYRKKIDAIDRKVVNLLKSRFEIARKTSVIKKTNKLNVTDKRRESEVLGNVRKYSRGHQEFMTDVFKKIISYSKKLQK